MGEVYRATDLTLNRDVAIKVLPGTFLNDAERLGRFQREAQVLASLNHTNIATIYGVEEEHGFRALVMELVEGPTLADRILGTAAYMSPEQAKSKVVDRRADIWAFGCVVQLRPWPPKIDREIE